MNIDFDFLDKLYKQYGYRSVKLSFPIRIYLYEHGRYFGADIIPLDLNEQTITRCIELKKEYGDGGFAVQLRKYKSNEEAALELYKSFFSYDATKKRIKNLYTEFNKAQTRLNGGFRYKYINSPFSINNETSSNSDIIPLIIEDIKKDTPQLIIIEASAGYGKTCTAYELLEKLLECEYCQNPLMTELSRNRGANIFRYILLDEIDREYPILDSNLVIYEIKSGNIPLIIDGFDELLHKSDIIKSEKKEVFSEVETMLDTIGNLLKNRAKIILTTRKTAIFAGNEFKEWLRKWNHDFSVNRYTIQVPRIKDWLGKTRSKLIAEDQFPVEYIANPVLLTYLRNLDEQEFLNHLNEPDRVVSKYFYALHEREIKRQDLRITPEDQYTIFKNVVKLLMEFDTSTENKLFLREIIIDQNKEILEKSLKLYSGEQTIDLIADKLINHALLDRKGRNEDQIGFVNDFIFGTFIGEIISEFNIKEIETLSSYMVELGATAYRVQNSTNKHNLWIKINEIRNNFESNVLFVFDITLKGGLQRNFQETIFTSLNIFKINFFEYKITNSVFINCKFKNCRFDTTTFDLVTFIECEFDNCECFNNQFLNEQNTIFALHCTQKSNQIIKYSNYENAPLNKDETHFEDTVLSKIYNLEKLFKSQRLMHLLKDYNKGEQKYLYRTLEKLQNEGLIKVSGLDLVIEINKLSTVKSRIDK